jgi:hypothetical protein
MASIPYGNCLVFLTPTERLSPSSGEERLRKVLEELRAGETAIILPAGVEVNVVPLGRCCCQGKR